MEREVKLIGACGATAGNLVGFGPDVEGTSDVESVGDAGVDLYPNSAPQAVGTEDTAYIDA